MTIGAEAPGQDRCPGVLRLHEAADGWLARVRLPGGRIGARALDAIARSATLGNGLIELTSRASVQIRGLPPHAADRCAAVLSAAGLLPSADHDRVRNILASPLAGRDPQSLSATDDLVVELDRALCADDELTALPGRFLFAVDDGTHFLGGHTADVALTAIDRDAFRLELAGAATSRTASRAQAPALALEAAREILRDPTLAAARLGAGGAAPHEPAPATARPRLELGMRRQADGRVALTMMPRLGRLDIDAVRSLGAIVRERQTELRLSAQRTLTLLDVDAATAEDTLERLGAAGLISDPQSGWHGLSACAGLGACAKALLDVRGEAERRAKLRSAQAGLEHWSACGRRCGRPAEAHTAFTATPAGLEVQTTGPR